VLIAATLGGLALCFVPIDPVRQLFWAAVVNGVVAVPIMAVMLVLAGRRAVMGEHAIGRRLAGLGWLATGIMAAVVAATFATA
jgi:Mn2+/Fe2+ NRAMP family transporter